MQHEGVRIGAQFGDDEWNALRHKTGDEGDVAGEAVELGDDDRALACLAGCEGGCELWSPVEGVGAFAGLDFGELGDEGVVLCLGAPSECGSLNLDAEA